VFETAGKCEVAVNDTWRNWIMACY